jgi:signal transduction histidine kinase
MSPADVPSEEHILLLIAPSADTTDVAAVLEHAGFACVSVPSLDALVDALQNGAGVLVVDEERITERAIRLLATALARRAPWSNLPIVVLTDGDPASLERLDALNLFGPATSSNVTILERPVHATTLTTVVRSALRARRRQYEVRDLLSHLESTNEQLREAQSALQNANETLEERVATRTQQVRTLAIALTAAEQRERTRISQILHDHLQQLLHGAKMWADLLTSDPDTVPAEAPSRITSLLEEAIDATRSLSVDLSPPVLHKEGLEPALQWLAERMAERHGLAVQLDVSPPLRVPEEELRALLFRVTRELLFNVVKHAEVDTATLRVASSPTACTVEVIDAGTGFDPTRLDAPSDSAEHFGLVHARERLELVGGELSVDTAPGQGTRVRVQVPLRLP